MSSTTKQWTPFFTGDYKRKTEHLTQQEHGAYLQLLMHCWTSGPLPMNLDRIYRIAGAFTDEEKASTRNVLEQFFDKQSDGYHNKKADKVKEEQQTRSERAAENGKKGGRPKNNPDDNPEKTQAEPTENPEQNQNYNLEKSFQNQNQIQNQDPEPKPELANASSARGADTFGAEGLRYLTASKNPNLQNLGWVEGYLSRQHTEIRNSRPDIPPAAILKTWQECCDAASAKGVGSPKWYQTVFENRIRDWKPSPQAGRSAILPVGKSKAERVLDAWKAGKELKWIFSGEVFPAKQLKPYEFARGKPEGFDMPDGQRGKLTEFSEAEGEKS